MGKTPNTRVAQLKQDILRGVYEQNCQSFGKDPALAPACPAVRQTSAERSRYGLLLPLVAFFVAVGALAYPGMPGRSGNATTPRGLEAVLPSGEIPWPAPRSAARTAQGAAQAGSVMGAGLLLPTAERMDPTLEVLRAAGSGEAEPPVPSPDPGRFGAPLLRAKLPLKDLFGLRARTIVIDPGHGGKDPGAVAPLGTREKDVTLDIARRLRDRLRARPGYEILMTRDDDSTVPLRRRVEFANAVRADLFISIHVNSIPGSDVNVVETYYFGPNSDGASLRLVEQENSGSGYRFSEFKEVLQKLGDTMKLQESRALALSIQDNLYRNKRRQDRGVRNLGIKTAPFVVLLGVDAPSVLSEVACLNNVEEERKLSQESYRDEIAAYLADGITDYLDQGTDNGEMRHGTGRLAAR
jgi:N-acetylmuramoyl-L-alanine amidase